MPWPLSVSAATMPASAVPWPFGSLFQAEPATNELPVTMFESRSGWDASTPVSRTATTAEPAGLTEPNTWSQPIFASDHWSAYDVSLGVDSALRLRSSSTDATLA